MKWKIKENLSTGSYGGNSVISDMLEYRGDIIECSEESFEGSGTRYKGWGWTREMVDPVVEPKVMTKADFVVGKRYKKIVGTLCLNEIFYCTKISDGTVYLNKTNILDYRSSYKVIVSPEKWEPVEEVVEEEEFQFGDMLHAGTGSKYAYLGRTPKGSLITMSEESSPAETGEVEAFIWCKGSSREFKKVEKVEESTTVELTMSEIADKIGINVKDLKIVD